MKSLIKSKIPDWDFEKEIECSSFSQEELLDVIREELWDLYTDILSACPVVPQGFFVESEIYDRVCGKAKEYITSNQNRWKVELTLFDDNGNEIQMELFNITELLLQMLEDDSGTGEFDARLSGYVESCLLEFVKNSTWHIENNCLWFGIDAPSQIWMINSETKQEDLEFWFEDDTWTVMSHLGDFSDCFLIWYTAECGCCAPDMSDIIDSCPIQFKVTDTVKSILKRVEIWNSENRN